MRKWLLNSHVNSYSKIQNLRKRLLGPYIPPRSCRTFFLMWVTGYRAILLQIIHTCRVLLPRSCYGFYLWGVWGTHMHHSNSACGTKLLQAPRNSSHYNKSRIHNTDCFTDSMEKRRVPYEQVNVVSFPHVRFPNFSNPYMHSSRIH